MSAVSKRAQVPYPIAARLRAGIVSGTYRTGMSFLTDLEKLVENEAVYEEVLYFPLSGELVDARGNVTSASAEMLAAYEQMIASALCRVQWQSLHSETYLFSDVDGLYQKLLSIQWSVERVEDRVVGKMVFLLTEEITEEEAEDRAEIEIIHSIIFTDLFKIHGAVMAYSESLLYAGFQDLNLTQIFMASIFLGSSGAVMDLSVDIISAVHEVVEKKPDIRPWEAVRSGLNVGRAAMGTMKLPCCWLILAVISRS